MSAAVAARVHQLTDVLHLSQDDVGEIVGTSGRTVARWSKGDSKPQGDARKRLLELRYVAEAAAEVIEPEDINLWMFEPNKRLDGDTPALRIRRGDYKSVLALIEALADGVIF